LSVRQLEELVKKPEGATRRRTKMKSPELVELEDDLQRRFGTKVTVTYRKGAGRNSHRVLLRRRAGKAIGPDQSDLNEGVFHVEHSLLVWL